MPRRSRTRCSLPPAFSQTCPSDSVCVSGPNSASNFVRPVLTGDGAGVLGVSCVAVVGAGSAFLRVLGPPAARIRVRRPSRQPGVSAPTLRSLCRRPEPERAVRHQKDVGAPRDLDIDVRRHPGLELEAGVRHVDDRLIRHDVLHCRGLQANLRHAAREVFGRKRMNAETHGLSRTDAANVRLVEACDTCIFVRSAARTNRVGADMLAATV